MLKANWILPDYNMGKVCPLFRKDFNIDKKPYSATLHITARGVYEATLNGRRVGDFIMAPGWTSYHNRLQVQSYDVTELLQEDNTLACIVLGGTTFLFIGGFLMRFFYERKSDTPVKEFVVHEKANKEQKPESTQDTSDLKDFLGF